jgi:hypothetical protein
VTPRIIVYTERVGGSNPSPPTSLRFSRASARRAEDHSEGCCAEVAQATKADDTEGLMRRFLAALLGFLIGYPVFAFAGYWAIALFSNNHFDGSVEASMTAAFVFGPAGALIGLIAGAILGKPKSAPGDLAPENKSLP